MTIQFLAPANGAYGRLFQSSKTGPITTRNNLHFSGNEPGDESAVAVPAQDWFSAIGSNNIAEVSRRIEAHEDVEQTLPDHTTGLILSIKQRFTDLANLLLDKKADPTQLNIKGKNALFYAVKTQNEPLITKLIQEGANINEPINMKGMTLLIRAAKKGKVDQVALLLKHGAKIAQRDADGKTALHWAISTGHQPVVAALLIAAASMSSPIDLLNQPDNFGVTPLILAAMQKRPETLAFLIQQGADFTKADDKGNTALSYAFGNHDQASVKILLSAGATIEGKPNLLSQALLEPEHYGDPDAFKLLLDKGGDPNVRDEKGQTPLIKTTLTNHFPAVEMLLKRGAYPNARDLSGHTAFMYAAKSCNFATMLPLLKGGADPCPEVDNEAFFDALDEHLSNKPATTDSNAKSAAEEPDDDDFSESFQNLFKEKDESRFPMKVMWPLKLYWSQDTRDAIEQLMASKSATK